MMRRRFLALSAAAGASAPRTFAATGHEREVMRFGVIADVQYADAEAQGERHYRASIPKLEAAVADLSKQELPFTLHLGDTIDRGFDSFAKVTTIFAKLGHPLRNLLGNHDFDVADAEKPKVAAALGMPADFHSFRHAGFRFVMLDTNDVSTYKHAEDDPATRAAAAAMKSLGKAPNAKPWNGGVSEKQLAWIEQQLAEAETAGESVIACGHHPLLPAEGHCAWNHAEVLAVLEKHRCVRAYLCGHNHAGNQVESPAGVPCVTFKSLLHEPGVTAYAVVRVLAPRWMSIEGRGREKTRVVEMRD